MKRNFITTRWHWTPVGCEHRHFEEYNWHGVKANIPLGYQENDRRDNPTQLNNLFSAE
jgi:hypothetical protein